MVNPSGDVVTAKTAFTSGASYNAANWNAAPGVAAKLDKTEASSTYQRPVKNTIAYIGDSHTDYGTDSSSSVIANVDRGFTTWAQVYLGHRLEAVIDAGIQGQRSDQVRARLQTDVIAFAPGWCHVLAGSNDIFQDRALVSIKTDLLAMWTDLRAAGIRVIAGTIPPCTGLTAPRQAALYDLNAWIREQGSAVPGLIVVDYHRVLADPGTDGWYSNYALADGIHIPLWRRRDGQGTGRHHCKHRPTAPQAGDHEHQPLQPHAQSHADGKHEWSGNRRMG